MKKNLPKADPKALERETAPIKLSTEVLSELEGEEAQEKSTRAFIADPIFDENVRGTVENQSESLEYNAESEASVEARETTEEVSILEELVHKQQETTKLAKSAYHTQKQRIRDRKHNRRMGTVKRYGFIVSFIIILLALIYFLPAFHVQRFQIDGIQNLSEKEVIDASEIQLDRHLLEGWGGGLGRIIGIRNGAAEDKIKAAFPYVNSVTVGPKFPGTVHIVVQERVPVSYVDYQGQIVLLDKDGIVLDIIRNLHKEIPIIYNAKLENPVPGEMVSEDVKKTIRPAILVLDALINNDTTANDDFSFFSQVKSITLTDGAETYITLSKAYADSGTRIKLGNRQTLDEAINWLRYAARTDNLLNLGEGTLDVTGTRKLFYPSRNEN